MTQPPGKRRARPQTPTYTQPSRGLFLWLWRRYLVQHLPLLILAVLLMAVEGSMLGALSALMRPMFDDVFLGGDTDALAWVGVAIMAIFSLRAVASVLQKVLLTRVAQMTAAQIRQDLVEHLMSLDGSFHQTHPPGHVMSRIVSDVESISSVWKTIITGAGRDLVAVVVLFGVAIGVDWRWALVACLGAPVVALPSVIVQRYVRARARETRDLMAQLSTRLNEIFLGIVPVKLNALEQYQAKQYRRTTMKMVRNEMRAAIGRSAIPGLIDIMAGLGFLGVLFYGGSEIIQGEKTVGEFMSFFTAIGLAFEPLRRLGALSGVWQTAAAGIERLKELLELRPGIASPQDPVPLPKGLPRIQLHDVHLSYGDTEVLRGLSFVAEAGRTTALVGASGAGKSTVFNLLTRLVDPDSGSVTVNGTPVDRLDLASLRGLYSVVSQEALLFDETLRENILLGRKDVTDAHLRQVLDDAHVSDFLPSLPQGLDSPVGPRGTNLSGGQRQRVAIARALLRDTPILLLDEATSALDAQSEQVVQTALERLAQGRTTIVIAHRLSTVRSADSIVVMAQGRVVDQGRHEELIARGGLYADLHGLQVTSDSSAPDGQDRSLPDSEEGSTSSATPGEASLLSRIVRNWFARSR